MNDLTDEQRRVLADYEDRKRSGDVQVQAELPGFAPVYDQDQDTAEVINALAVRVHRDNVAKGFWDMCNTRHLGPDNTEIVGFDAELRNKGELIALMHSELSEALEALRKNLMDDKLPHRRGDEVELADTIIRILDYGAAFGLDIGGAIIEKLAYNRGREYKHGKAF